MRDLTNPNRQREIWITQGHLWALALAMFFIGVLAFFVGLLFGRSQASSPVAEPTAQLLVTADVQGDALDELLARLESLEVDDPQDGALTFPGTLSEGEVLPVPELPVVEDDPETLVLPGREPPEPPEGGATSGKVPSSGWAVQVASFVTVEEADEKITELAEAGIEAYRQAAMVQGETRHRVRVGGYGSRASADRGREDLAARLGVQDAIVVQAP